MGNEMAHEQRDVVLAFAQCRQMYAHEVDAVVEVFAEGMSRNHCRQVGIRGTHHTHIGAARGAVAQDFVGVILQHTQQLHLTSKVEFANLVEEYGAALSHLKPSAPVVACIGECSGLVSEHLAFKQRSRYATEVDLHQRPRCTLAMLVYVLRNDFLACARLARDEYRCHRGRHAVEGGKDGG